MHPARSSTWASSAASKHWATPACRTAYCIANTTSHSHLTKHRCATAGAHLQLHVPLGEGGHDACSILVGDQAAESLALPPEFGLRHKLTAVDALGQQLRGQAGAASAAVTQTCWYGCRAWEVQVGCDWRQGTRAGPVKGLLWRQACMAPGSPPAAGRQHAHGAQQAGQVGGCTA